MISTTEPQNSLALYNRTYDATGYFLEAEPDNLTNITFDRDVLTHLSLEKLENTCTDKPCSLDDIFLGKPPTELTEGLSKQDFGGEPLKYFNIDNNGRIILTAAGEEIVENVVADVSNPIK